MIDNETLFLKTLADLERRLRETDPYEILLISGLLRKLFLDDHPLVDRINKEHRIKIFFQTVHHDDPRADSAVPVVWSVQDGLDPETSPPFRPRVTLSRDQFFQKLVTIVNGHALTVRDIILFEANIVGAVHAGAPRSEKEKALHDLETSLSIGGYAASLRQLMAIARVILRALQPLRDAVAKI
ncbi:hypothetical protein GCM10028862_20630 [Luteimonas pelagia]